MRQSGLKLRIRGKKYTHRVHYRHPHMNNMDDFNHYMEKTLSKINKENKEVYITGDFNIDLLKYEFVPEYQDNMMSSNGIFLKSLCQHV